MDNEENLLKEYFNEIKRIDATKQIPEFYLPKRKRQKSIYYGIAATVSIIIISTLYFINDDRASEQDEVILVTNKVSDSSSLLKADQTLEEWQSPTQSLINDF